MQDCAGITLSCFPKVCKNALEMEAELRWPAGLTAALGLNCGSWQDAVGASTPSVSSLEWVGYPS